MAERDAEICGWGEKGVSEPLLTREELAALRAMPIRLAPVEAWSAAARAAACWAAVQGTRWARWIGGDREREP